MDTTDILEGQQVNHYFTMVGQRQWLIPLGTLAIQAHVISMSSPRLGHLQRLQRIYAYVIRTRDYATRFRTTEPDYSYLLDKNFDWAHTVYGAVQEIIPNDIPDPLGQNCYNYNNSRCKFESLFSHWEIFDWLFTFCKPYSN